MTMSNEGRMIISRLNRMEIKLDQSIVDIAGLKVKAGVWGLLAGLIPVVAGLGVWILSVAN